MSIYSQPTMPGYLWAQRPTPAGMPALASAPQTWIGAPRPSGGPASPWAAAIPAWPQPTPPTARPRHRWLPIAMAASVVALASAAALVTTLASRAAHTTAATNQPATAVASPAPAAPPLVRDESLPALLLDTATINAVMSTRDLAVNPILTTDRLYIDATDKPECGGVWANANRQAYAGSGWQAVQTQYLREPDRPQHEVFQSVVSFPSAAAAKDYVAAEAKRWPVCRNTAATTTNPTLPAQTWFIASVGQTGDILTSVSNREGAAGYACQHALTARNNVVIDTDACGRDVLAQGSTIAGRIAEQISRTL